MESIAESILEQGLVHKLWFMSHIWPNTCICLAVKQQIIFIFLKAGKKINGDSMWPAKPKVFTIGPLQ